MTTPAIHPSGSNALSPIEHHELLRLETRLVDLEEAGYQWPADVQWANERGRTVATRDPEKAIAALRQFEQWLAGRGAIGEAPRQVNACGRRANLEFKKYESMMRSNADGRFAERTHRRALGRQRETVWMWVHIAQSRPTDGTPIWDRFRLETARLALESFDHDLANGETYAVAADRKLRPRNARAFGALAATGGKLFGLGSAYYLTFLLSMEVQAGATATWHEAWKAAGGAATLLASLLWTVYGAPRRATKELGAIHYPTHDAAMRANDQRHRLRLARVVANDSLLSQPSLDLRRSAELWVAKKRAEVMPQPHSPATDPDSTAQPAWLVTTESDPLPSSKQDSTSIGLPRTNGSENTTHVVVQPTTCTERGTDLERI